MIHHIPSSPSFKYLLPLIFEADIILYGKHKWKGAGSVHFILPTVLTLEPSTMGSLVPNGFVFVFLFFSKRKKSYLQHLPQKSLSSCDLNVCAICS